MRALLTAFDICTQIRLGRTPTGLTWAVLVQIMLAGEMVYTFLLLYTVHGRCLYTVIMWILLQILLKPQLLFHFVLTCQMVNEIMKRGANFLYTVDLFNVVFLNIIIA